MSYSINLSGEGSILTSNIDAVVKKKASVTHMVATDEHLYVLYSNSSFEILSAADVNQVVKASANLGDVTTFALNSGKKEIWGCDKKGAILIFNAEDLSKVDPGKEIKTIYGHPGLSIAASPDGGSIMAVGDAKGYTTIFDGASGDQKHY